MIKILTRFRAKIKKIIRPLVEKLALTGLEPNHVTILGLVVAFLTPLSVIYFGSLGYIVFVAISALLDALDGELARLKNRASRLGAFLDSFSDRVSDVLYIYSLIYLGLSSDIVILLIVLSILISYARARAEGLGISVEGVGLMERGERIIALILIAATAYFSKDLLLISSVVLVVLLIYTLLERVYRIMIALRSV